MFPIRHFESQQKSPGGRNWVNAPGKIDRAPISLCLLPEHAYLRHVHMYTRVRTIHCISEYLGVPSRIASRTTLCESAILRSPDDRKEERFVLHKYSADI